MSNQNGFDSDEQEAYEYARWQQEQYEKEQAEEEYQAYLDEQQEQVDAAAQLEGSDGV